MIFLPGTVEQQVKTLQCLNMLLRDCLTLFRKSRSRLFWEPQCSQFNAFKWWIVTIDATSTNILPYFRFEPSIFLKNEWTSVAFNVQTFLNKSPKDRKKKPCWHWLEIIDHFWVYNTRTFMFMLSDEIQAWPWRPSKQRDQRCIAELTSDSWYQG